MKSGSLTVFVIDEKGKVEENRGGINSEGRRINSGLRR